MKSQTQLVLSSHLHVIFGLKRIEEKFSEISLGKLECHRGRKGFPGGSAGQESGCNAGDLGKKGKHAALPPQVYLGWALHPLVC